MDPSPRRSWTPSAWGSLLTFSNRWSISTDGQTLTVDLGNHSYSVDLTHVRRFSQEQGMVWATVHLELDTGAFKVDGIPNEIAAQMELAVDEEIEAWLSRQIQHL